MAILGVGAVVVEPWQEVLAGTCIVFRHLEPFFTCQKRGGGGNPSQMVDGGRLRHLVPLAVTLLRSQQYSKRLNGGSEWADGEGGMSWSVTAGCA